MFHQICFFGTFLVAYCFFQQFVSWLCWSRQLQYTEPVFFFNLEFFFFLGPGHSVSCLFSISFRVLTYFTVKQPLPDVIVLLFSHKPQLDLTRENLMVAFNICSSPNSYVDQWSHPSPVVALAIWRCPDWLMLKNSFFYLTRSFS